MMRFPALVESFRARLLLLLALMLGLTLGIQYYFNLKAVKANARMIIGLDVPSFLPSIDWLTVLALWICMTLLAVFVGSLVLRLQGITTAQAPIDLVKS